MKQLCVFCGSSHGNDPAFAEAARSVGLEIARRGWILVYGGARVGLMGTLSDTTLAAGGKVIGVIPQAMVEREIAHDGLTELHVVRTMHERKAMMVRRANAFLALPGGVGTLDEFCEVVTWSQLGIHAHPCGLLNLGGFFDPLLAQLDRAVAAGFLRPGMRNVVLAHAEAVPLLDQLSAWHAPKQPRLFRADEI